MNNDLEQFTDLELEGMAHGNNPVANAYRELLAFRMAEKQAKPFGYLCEWDNGNQVIYYGEAGNAIDDDWSVMPSVHKNLPLYTTPQPPHAVQDGWIKCSDRLPDDDSFVLVTNGKHTGMGAYLRDDRLEDDERWQDEHFEFINKQSKYPVTHWMSLPPNPEK